MAMSSIVCTAWNARGINTAHAYMHELLLFSDVVIVSEHWLPQHELYKLDHLHVDFQSTATSGQCVSQNTPHAWGGVAVLYRKCIDFNITVLNIDSKRLCGIHLLQSGHVDLYIIGVYMPHVGCKNDDFIDELVILEELIVKYQQCGDVLIMGDFNCHFGTDVGARGWGKTTRQAGHLLQVIKRHGLKIVDLDSSCEGPNFTYFSENIGKTYIDHCIGSCTLSENVSKCKILQDSIQNTSDHLAITVSIKLNATIQTECNSSVVKSVAWHKLSQIEIVEKYTMQIDVQLSKCLMNVDLNLVDKMLRDVQSVEKLLNVIIELMHACSDKLPKKGFQKALKPYWTHSLTELCKRKKHIMKIWRMAGCPRQCDNVIWNEYKLVKREFRHQQRSAMREFELKHMKDFSESCEVDTKFYWHLVNLSRKVKRKRVTPVKTANNTILVNELDIKQSWYEYFKDMFTPKTSTQYCGAWFSSVNASVETKLKESYGKETNILRNPFTLEELQVCIARLKHKKAAGFDQITAEHIKYGGNTLHECILLIMNSMLGLEIMPRVLKQGVLVPIPKKGKDSMLRENNRGITLLSVVYKLYQCLLKGRLSLQHDVIESVQGAGRKGVSCLHTSYLLRETIQYNRENGKDVFIAFLDARKAFDSVWINGLLLKLFELNVDTKLWRIIKNMYTEFRCTVRIKDEFTEWFDILQGVQQGAPLSLWLYEVFVNDLLVALKNTNLGAKIDNIIVTCPAYADDVAIVATTHGKLQSLLDVAYSHSVKWRYAYNADKSEILCTNNAWKSHVFWLGMETIPVRESCKHVGTIMSTAVKHDERSLGESVYRGKQTLAALRGIGSARVPVGVCAMSKLYWTMCVPILTYGCEVLPLRGNCRNILESAHWDMGKTIQHIPKQTPNPCVLRQIGWTNINGHVDMLKLTFLWRILEMSVTCIYKQVAIKRILSWYNSSEKGADSPVYTILNVAYKYGVLDMFVNKLFDFENVSLLQFKDVVKQKIRLYEHQQHVVTLSMYKRTSLYATCINTRATWPWYIHASRYPECTKNCSYLVRKLIGVTSDGATNVCLCGESTSVSHVLFECEYIKCDRERLWCELDLVLPNGMRKDLHRMSTNQKTIFILNGLGSQYVPEFSNVYSEILKCITTTLRKHDQLFL